MFRININYTLPQIRFACQLSSNAAATLQTIAEETARGPQSTVQPSRYGFLYGTGSRPRGMTLDYLELKCILCAKYV